MKRFGDFIRDLRLKKRMTLREFCKRAEIDPGNWSKIERGISLPPKGKEVLSQIADVLSVPIESEEYKSMLDYAAIGHIPLEITEQTIISKLPMFFRTARGAQPTSEEMENLIDIIRKDQLGVD